MSYSFRFVCQRGDLEYKALVLAASLRYHLSCAYELIACIPSDTDLLRPSEIAIDSLISLGCQVQYIHNPISPDYLIGHKFGSLVIPTKCAYKVFLDSDILCTQVFTGFPIKGQPPFLAKLEDWNHHTQDEWNTLYNYFDLGMPRFIFRSTVLDEPMPLYCNAGVLCIDAESQIIDRWLEVALDIEHNLEIPRKRPNLDQLALAITLVTDGYDTILLDERYNYPAELRTFDPILMPFFCHYHNPAMILANKYLTDLSRKIAQNYPILLRLVKSQKNPDWKYIFDFY